MLKLRTSLVAIGVLCGVLGPMAVLAPRVVAQDQGAESETAQELLEDGLDALADHADESGRRLLGRVISDFPGSTEASRAKRALSVLDRGDSNPDDRAAIKADEAERTAEYRQAFLFDIGDRVFFAESSAVLGGRARSLVENQARWLNARPDLTVIVIGRSDDGGNGSAARELSLRRAQAVLRRLVTAGLAENRIEIRAAGNDDRLAVCDDPLCRAENRNAEVLINDWHLTQGWQSSQQVPGAAAKASPTNSVSHPDFGSADQFSQ